MSNAVRVYSSADNGATGVSGEVETLIQRILDPCLVNGYGQITLDSLVVSGNVATATKNPHNFVAVGSVGPVIRIAGATPSGFNGDWRVTITSPSTFAFVTTGIVDGTATGTITAKRAPLGFSKEWSGTNTAAYRSSDVLGTRLQLRVGDNGVGSAIYARVRGYEAFADQSAFDNDTGTGAFPTNALQSGGGYLHKSSAASSTARAWRLFGDSQAFSLFIQYNGTDWSGFFFGDVISERPGDSFHSLFIATSNTNGNASSYGLIGDGSILQYMARGIGQGGTAVQVAKYAAGRSLNSFGYQGVPYNPGSADNPNFYCSPVWVMDYVSPGVFMARATMPGVYCPMHPASALTDGSLQADIAGLSGKTLFIQTMNTGGSMNAAAIDITGPWR